jgi:hypothetical protein
MKKRIVLLLFASMVFTSSVYALDLHSKGSTMVTRMESGNMVTKWVRCPVWDWDLIPYECKGRFMLSWNCLPRCGKWEGDKPDIGAWEWIDGITAAQPWGIWEGIPFGQEEVENSKPIPQPSLDEIENFGIR